MRVVTILGTRPEIIRLSLVIPKLDAACDHKIIHTEQNYDYELNQLFFQQLRVRKPDFFLGAKGTFAEQLSVICTSLEKLLIELQPDRFLVLGDTNSSLGAIIAKRLGIPVFHMEAGNRSFDNRIPEEVNRRIIDACSDVWMPYTERSRQNLLAEGVPGRRIYVTGNPIYEVISHFEKEINEAAALSEHALRPKEYFLATLHRAENVDHKERLEQFFGGFESVSDLYKVPLILSCHPRLAKRIKEFNITFDSSKIRLQKPFGFFEFLQLEKNAFCVLSDSGTVQEECAILGVPNVTVRDVTERPETMECGTNYLSGANRSSIERGVRLAVSGTSARSSAPQEYLRLDVSDTVAKIVTSYLHGHAS
ncbi:MAG: UDP-N-acetylglucosamine 2-epimerase (non-hydrolyzing) [Deltaproteobacteria bacterium]|nr:UDP-N-acetylglucosamine 2-epimerase (non-hydrolyzing) [Deltaproteobacteria bacterium]